jgi:hypothetical protein
VIGWFASILEKLAAFIFKTEWLAVCLATVIITVGYWGNLCVVIRKCIAQKE